MNEAEWNMQASRYGCFEAKDAHGGSKGVFVTCPVRLSFQHLTKPDDKGKFNAAFLFPQSADLTVLMNAARAAAIAKYGDVSRIPKTFRSPFKDQSELADKYEGFAKDGSLFINASSLYAPKFYAADGKSLLSLTDDLLWDGCYVRAGLTVYTYDKDKEGKSVTPGASFGLSFVQFFSYGDKLSGGIDATEYLQPIEGVTSSAPVNAQTMSMPAGAMNGAAPAATAAAKPKAGALF